MVIILEKYPKLKLNFDVVPALMDTIIDYINERAQIINVASYYDNLACNRTPMHVASNRDALRALLELGSKRFSVKMLYTFVHMYNYDDPREFNDMII